MLFFILHWGKTYFFIWLNEIVILWSKRIAIFFIPCYSKVIQTIFWYIIMVYVHKTMMVITLWNTMVLCTVVLFFSSHIVRPELLSFFAILLFRMSFYINSALKTPWFFFSRFNNFIVHKGASPTHINSLFQQEILYISTFSKSLLVDHNRINILIAFSYAVIHYLGTVKNIVTAIT